MGEAFKSNAHGTAALEIGALNDLTQIPGYATDCRPQLVVAAMSTTTTTTTLLVTTVHYEVRPKFSERERKISTNS